MVPVNAAVLSFGLVFCSVNGAALLLRFRARRTERLLLDRLAESASKVPNASIAPLIKPAKEDISLVSQLSHQVQKIAKVRSLLERAGETPDSAPVLRSCAISGVLPAVAFLCFVPGPMRPFAALVFACGSMFPLWRLARKARARLAAFEAQFPDGLEFIARSMRAGHAFSVSLEMLFQEFEQPMAGEFRRTFEEQNLGLPLEVALAKLAERMPLMDVRFFSSAVLLQRKTGGNLTEILDNLAHLIRERYKLRGKIKAVSAHGRMTGKALSAIPILVGVLMLFMNPDYASFFIHTTTGNEMIIACIILQAIGYMVIQRIVNIEV